jgi:hypothetical protein
MTDGWPAFCADNVPLVAPLFLFLGLYLWYSHTVKSRPKPVFEPEYAFEFKMVDKNADAAVEDGEQELVQEPKLQVHSEIEETVEPQLKSKTATLIPKAKLEAEPQLHLEPESESLPDHYVFGRTINKSTT